MVANKNTRAKSTLDAIKSLAENDGDPNIKVAIRDTALDDTIVMTFLVRECYGSPKKQEF
jgi:hypothetical protein